MTRLRSIAIPLVAAALATAGVVVASSQTSSASSAGTAAASATYGVTIAGTDLHSLDPRLWPMFAAGGGVMGVWEGSGVEPTVRALEAGLNLPVGAKVTSIQITTSACAAHGTPTVVFGSYQPTTRNTIQSVNFTLPTVCGAKSTTKA